MVLFYKSFPPPVLALKDTAVTLLFLCHLLILQFQFLYHAADNRGGVFLHVTCHVRIGVKREARVCVSEMPESVFGSTPPFVAWVAKVWRRS